jgi:glucose-1-phosphate cytidylyltransferase
MKVVILAGGLGTRLQEETVLRPKPMVEVGGRPILWHIMKTFGAQGFDEFVVALGYKSEVVKDYFVNYRHRRNSMSVHLGTGKVEVHRDADEAGDEAWTVHLLDTGVATQTAGRVRRAAEFIGPEPFLLTYGDGVADVDVRRLLAFHRRHGRLATVTAVRPPSRFGGIAMEGDRVARFEEKPQIGEGWINGGFFVLEPGVAKYLGGDDQPFEREPLERLAEDGELFAYRHDGFWQCMDTLRDVRYLEGLWQSGKVPWKVWKE